MKLNLKELCRGFDVVGFLQQYVEVRPFNRSGEYEMYCPYCLELGHRLKMRPFLNVAKGIYHCFRCESSGMSIDLVMKFGNFTFGQALRFMEDGIDERLYDLNDTQADDLKDQYETWRQTELAQILELPTFPLPPGFVSLRGQQLPYTSRRRLSQEVIDRFGLGYCPEGSVWVDPSTGVPHNYSNRLIIPDTDINGRVLYWTARDMTDRHPQKYKNPPGTWTGIGSGSLIFNFHRASRYTRGVIVEGYLDSLRVGDDCMATSGMGLKGYHLQWLMRGGFKELVLLDDADGSVPAAHIQAKATQLSQFFAIFIGKLPWRGDPDSFNHKTLRDAIANATPYREETGNSVDPEELLVLRGQKN